MTRKNSPSFTQCIGVSFCVLLILISLTGNVKCNDDSVLDAKSSILVNKILKAYLLEQLEELDKEDDSTENDRQFIQRRQLKSQGIMSRLRNKMDHDLNKYGWDK